MARQDRVAIASQIITHIADQALLMGIFYTIEPILVNQRVLNVVARTSRGTHGWNAHEWDVKP